MKTIDMLITELRDTAYDTGWYAGKIEQMVAHKVNADAYRKLHTIAILARRAAEEALRKEAQK